MLALAQPSGAAGLSSLFQPAEVEYRPGGAAVDKVWTRFYAGDYEAELSVPLIKAGRAMTPAITAAVAHRDMKYRRYAIGALGEIGDRRALPQLESILKAHSERDYFRADALEAIHQIDESLGYQYATEYQRGNGLLGTIAQTITEAEISAIMSALRAPLQKAVRKPAKFRANQVNVENGWAFVRGVPEARDGKPMNYTGTPYAEQVELGMFDDNFSGLLRKKNGNWSVVTWNIGATDVVYAGWADNYGAPATLIK